MESSTYGSLADDGSLANWSDQPAEHTHPEHSDRPDPEVTEAAVPVDVEEPAPALDEPADEDVSTTSPAEEPGSDAAEG